MASRAWAQRLRGSGLGAAATTSTSAGISEAQTALQTILASVAVNMQQPGATWSKFSTSVPAQANSEVQQIVQSGQLSASDASNLLTQFNLSLAEQWQNLTASMTEASNTPSSASLVPTPVGPTPDTITLPIVGTITYTEAAIGAVAILGVLWLVFGQKSGRR